MSTYIEPNQRIVAQRTAYRTVNGLRIVATYNGGPYIDLHWDSAHGPAFEVINVWDYRKGERERFNLSAKLTEWIKQTGICEIRNYRRHT